MNHRWEKHIIVVLILAVFSQIPISAQKDQDSKAVIVGEIIYVYLSMYILASALSGELIVNKSACSNQKYPLLCFSLRGCTYRLHTEF